MAFKRPCEDGILPPAKRAALEHGDDDLAVTRKIELRCDTTEHELRLLAELCASDTGVAVAAVQLILGLVQRSCSDTAESLQSLLRHLEETSRPLADWLSRTGTHKRMRYRVAHGFRLRLDGDSGHSAGACVDSASNASVSLTPQGHSPNLEA